MGVEVFRKEAMSFEGRNGIASGVK